MTTEKASCMFFGGAENPQAKGFEGHRDKPKALLKSVQHDLRKVVDFAADLSRYNEGGIKVTRTLINKDVEEDVSGPAKFVYANKAEARKAVRSFLSTSRTNYLILFMSGSGEQRRLKCKSGLMEESFMLPNAGGKALEYYTDSELTEDIKKDLPDSKTLYIVCNCVHSGGMLNTWELDAKEKKYVAMFASAQKDILKEPAGSKFIDKFCEHAMPGLRLMDIAGRIQDDFQGTSVFPSFIPLRPNFASAPFLKAT